MNGSKILLLCHYILKDDLTDDFLYTKNHSNYELIGLLNGLYKQSWINSNTFQYPLSQDAFKNLLRHDVIHTLDYYETNHPAWKKIYKERKTIEHSTYNQNIVDKIQCPKLLKNLGTYDLIIMVNAPIQSVRLQPILYMNVISLLKPGGYFLADHRVKSEIRYLPFGQHQHKLILGAQEIVEDKTFVLYPVRVPIKCKYCGILHKLQYVCQFNRHTHPRPISLNKQLIYEKIEYLNGI